jgi:hypothetical protein
MRLTRFMYASLVLVASIAGGVRVRAQDASAKAVPQAAIFAALRDPLGAGRTIHVQWRTCGGGPLRGIGSPVAVANMPLHLTNARDRRTLYCTEPCASCRLRGSCSDADSQSVEPDDASRRS